MIALNGENFSKPRQEESDDSEGKREFREIQAAKALSEKKVGDRAVIINKNSKDFRSSNMETDWIIERFMPGGKVLVTRGEGNNKEGREIEGGEFEKMNFQGSEDVVDTIAKEHGRWQNRALGKGGLTLEKQKAIVGELRKALDSFQKGEFRPAREVLYDELLKELKSEGKGPDSGSLEEIEGILDARKKDKRGRMVQEYNQAGSQVEEYDKRIVEAEKSLIEIIRQAARKEIPDMKLLSKKMEIERDLDYLKSSRNSASERFEDLQKKLNKEDYNGREDELFNMIRTLDERIEESEQNE